MKGEEASNIELTIHKLVPPILLACIFALTQAYILTGQNRDNVEALTQVNKKQWGLISELRRDVTVLKEQQRMFLTREQYYKEKLK